MNKNKILSGGGKNLTGGGKWGWRGREVGEEGEGSGVKGGGKWGLGTPLSTPSLQQPPKSVSENAVSSISSNKSYPTYHLRTNTAEIYVFTLWSVEMINIMFKV